MSAYYNEIDAEKAQWIRELIKAGVVAPGDVDERSICDVQPEDVRNYTQCHWFAGIAVWSYALRLAGWPDDRPVWTGSCPCPSFSCAGKGEGFDDARHLWPQWYRLIRQCRPGTVFGEQVNAAIGHGWLDLVSGDLEAQGYAIASAVLGAHSAGAPHIRQRLYFVAHAQHDGHAAADGVGKTAEPSIAAESQHLWQPSGGSDACERAHAEQRRLQQHDAGARSVREPDALGATGERDDSDIGRSQIGWPESAAGMGGRIQRRSEGSHIGAEASQSGSGPLRSDHALGAGLEGQFGDVRDGRGPGWLDPLTARSVAGTGATGGFWADCDWWYGRDGKYRPIGPGLSPLAHGAAARVLRLRGYGDAINAQVAKAFIESFMEAVLPPTD